MQGFDFGEYLRSGQCGVRVLYLRGVDAGAAGAGAGAGVPLLLVPLL
jgi:hypothetical protein